MGKYNNVDSVCTINVSNKIVQQKNQEIDWVTVAVKRFSVMVRFKGMWVYQDGTFRNVGVIEKNGTGEKSRKEDQKQKAWYV